MEEINDFYNKVIYALWTLLTISVTGGLGFLYRFLSQNKKLKIELKELKEKQNKIETERTITAELETFRKEIKEIVSNMVTAKEFEGFKKLVTERHNTALSEYRNSKIEFRITCQEIKKLLLETIGNTKPRREKIELFFEQIKEITEKRFNGLEPQDIIDSLPKKDEYD